jgi:HlyD family secretion protein
MSKKWIVIIIVAALVVALIVVSTNRSKEGRGIAVTFAELDSGKMIEKVSGIGKIEPDLQVQISAKVAGEIVRMDVKDGDPVTKGQFLLQLEKEQYEAAHERAKSNLKAAKANLLKSRSNLNRTRQLAEQKLASDAEMEAAKADYDYQESQVERANADLEDALQALQKTTINSPIEGTVTSLLKEKGEIAIGSTFQKDVIMTVADLATMQARIEIDENDIVKVTIGDTADVEIDAFPDRTFKGIVKEVAHSATVTGLGTQQEVTNFEVRIDLLDFDAKFRPGMSCNADIITEEKDDVLRVPIQSVAVRTPEELAPKKKRGAKIDTTDTDPKTDTPEADNNQLVEVVFVAVNDTAYARPIKRGISDDNYYEVLDGLSIDDKVITGPYRALTNTLQNGKAVKEQKKGPGQGR